MYQDVVKVVGRKSLASSWGSSRSNFNDILIFISTESFVDLSLFNLET